IDHPPLLSRFGEWIDRLDIHDPDLATIRAALQMLSGGASGSETIDRQALSLHLTATGEERDAARLSRCPEQRAPKTGDGAAGAGAELEAEWLALVTREVVLPAIKEELTELRQLVDAGGDEAAFARFQALSGEARKIEARALEVKLDAVPDSAPTSNET